MPFLIENNTLRSRANYQVGKVVVEAARLAALISCSISLAACSGLRGAEVLEAPTSILADNGLLIYESADSRNKAWIDGRVGVTVGAVNGSDNEFNSGTELRRARLAVKTIFDSDWAAELDVDVTDNEIELKDAWIGYLGWPNTAIKIGNQKVPNGLEQLETSRWITFVERALPGKLVDDRRLGVTFRRWGNSWHATVGVFGEEPGDGAEAGEKEGWGVAARFTSNVQFGDDNLIHFGLSGSAFTPDGDDKRIRIRQRPEAHFVDRLLHTGQIENVERNYLIGAEVASRTGPVSLQAEYLLNKVDRNPGSTNADFSGWYAYGSWMVNGGRRSYVQDSGEFGFPVHPDGGGAMEVALRYSTLDLNDIGASIEGGNGRNITLGLNWYPNSHIRFATNVTWVNNDRFADGDGDLVGSDDFMVLTGLLQVNF